MFAHDRVKSNTCPIVNDRIEKAIDHSILETPDEAIQSSLQQLEEEWSVDRWIETHAAAAALVGVGLSLLVNRRLVAFPIAIASSLLTHGIQGYYPLLPLMRYLGARTRAEIDREKFGLAQRIHPRDADHLMLADRRRGDLYDPVRRSSSLTCNAKIDLSLEESVRCVAAGGPASIHKRLKELETEWDMERVLQTNAASLALSGLALSLRDRRWLWLPAGVFGFLLQHALQGWCPPLSLLRRLGIRTQREIDREVHALLSLL